MAQLSKSPSSLLNGVGHIPMGLHLGYGVVGFQPTGTKWLQEVTEKYLVRDGLARL